MFEDGTTATDRKTLTVASNPPSQPSQPQTPPSPQTPQTPAPQIPSDTSDSEQNLLMFDDVAPDTYYYDAVQWAAQKNITQGTADRIFSPDAICTRAQINPPTQNAFT